MHLPTTVHLFTHLLSTMSRGPNKTGTYSDETARIIQNLNNDIETLQSMELELQEELREGLETKQALEEELEEHLEVAVAATADPTTSSPTAETTPTLSSTDQRKRKLSSPTSDEVDMNKKQKHTTESDDEHL